MALKASKFAPKTPLETLAQTKADKLKQGKAKAIRLLGRLQWKSELLIVSHLKAVEVVQAEMGQNSSLTRCGGSHFTFLAHASGVNWAHIDGKKQAESMFKVDFFEFYTLLERYITVCLDVFGIHVSASVPRPNINALRYLTDPGLAQKRPEGLHAFHANLLAALDDENNPLYHSLGSQEVRFQLGLAKDYRNAWKDADSDLTSSNWDIDHPQGNAQLQHLDLDKMLKILLAGCEHAQHVVQDYQGANLSDLTSRDFEPRTDPHETMDIEDVPYEFMDDAMELD